MTKTANEPIPTKNVTKKPPQACPPTRAYKFLMAGEEGVCARRPRASKIYLARVPGNIIHTHTHTFSERKHEARNTISFTLTICLSSLVFCRYRSDEGLQPPEPSEQNFMCSAAWAPHGPPRACMAFHWVPWGREGSHVRFHMGSDP